MSSLGSHSSLPGTTDSAHRSVWCRATKAQVVAACFTVLFLTAQIVVPIVQLVSASRPARFGWQMYSVASVAPRFELLMRDGTRQPVSIEPYVASLRADVPLARFLPPHLCQVFPAAAAVSYQIHDASPEVYQCGA